VIRHRLAVFVEQTRPLVDYYRGRGILLELNTNRPQAEVHAELRAKITAALGVPLSRAGHGSSLSPNTSRGRPATG
jgi:hypothetical protein